MKTVVAKFRWLIAVLVGTGAPLRAALPDTITEATPSFITQAVSSRPTHCAANLAPSSQLTREQAFILASALSQISGHDIVVRAVAPTGSMRPYFDEKALLLLEAVPFSELHLGDVVTFFHPGLQTEVVHRLVEKRGEVFWSKGDHNAAMDNVYVTPENFRRRLVGVIYLKPGIPAQPVTVAAMPGRAGR